MKTLSLTCENCGSVDITLIDENLAKCNHCDTKIIIQEIKEEEDSPLDELKRMGVIKAQLAIRPTVEMDLREFERKALVDLFLDAETPLGVVKGTFGEAHENVAQYLRTDALYQGTLIVDIGYRHAFASFSDTSDGAYDWRPYEKAYPTTHQCTTPIHKGEAYREHTSHTTDIVDACIKKETDSSAICDIRELGAEFVQVDDEIIEMASKRNNYSIQSELESEVNWGGMPLPGDAQKFVDYDSRYLLTSAITIAEKEYVLQSEFDNGQVDSVLSCNDKSGKIEHYGVFKYTGEKSLKDIGMSEQEQQKYRSMIKETEAERALKSEKERAKVLSTIQKTISIPLIGLCILLCMLLPGLGVAISLGLFFVAMPLISKITEKSKVRIDACTEKVREEQKANPKPTKELFYKLERLNEILVQRGLEPVGEEEALSYAKDYWNFDGSSY